MQIIPHFFFVFPPPRLTSPASATSSAIVPRPALLIAFRFSPIASTRRPIYREFDEK